MTASARMVCMAHKARAHVKRGSAAKPACILKRICFGCMRARIVLFAKTDSDGDAMLLQLCSATTPAGPGLLPAELQKHGCWCYDV